MSSVILDASNPLPIRVVSNGDGTFSLATSSASPGGTLTDRSGTTPDTADHVLAAANAARSYLLVQNNAASADLWINFDLAAVASQPSILVSAGNTLIWGDGGFVPRGALHAIGAAAVPYTVKAG